MLCHICWIFVDAHSHATVYQSMIQYRPFNAKGEESAIEASDEYAFKDFDELIAEVPKAKMGLEQAIEAVIDRLIEEISPAAV